LWKRSSRWAARSSSPSPLELEAGGEFVVFVAAVGLAGDRSTGYSRFVSSLRNLVCTSRANKINK
jgi:hypothetical protein